MSDVPAPPMDANGVGTDIAMEGIAVAFRQFADDPDLFHPIARRLSKEERLSLARVLLRGYFTYKDVEFLAVMGAELHLASHVHREKLRFQMAKDANERAETLQQFAARCGNLLTLEEQQRLAAAVHSSVTEDQKSAIEIVKS